MNRLAGVRFRQTIVFALAAVASVAAAAKRSLEAYTTIAGVRLGVSAFGDARRLLGAAPLVHNGGDAAGSKRHMCFTGPDGTVLVLACWEGCGTGDADEYQLARSVGRVDFGAHGYRPPPAFDPRCVRTGKLSAATPVGSIRLGMPRREVVAALGEPEGETAGSLEYEDGRFHLAVTLAGDRVVAVGGAFWWE